MSLSESNLKTLRSYAHEYAAEGEYGRSCTKEELSKRTETIYQAGVQKMRESLDAKRHGRALSREAEDAKAIAEADKAIAEADKAIAEDAKAIIAQFPGIFAGLTFDGIPLMDAIGFPYTATPEYIETRSIAIMDDAAHMLVLWLLSIIALGPSIAINLAKAKVVNPQHRAASLINLACSTLYYMNDERVLNGAIKVIDVHVAKFNDYCKDGAPLDRSLSKILGPEGLALLDYYTSSVNATDRDDIVFRVHQDVPDRDSRVLKSAELLIDIGAKLSQANEILSIAESLPRLKASPGVPGAVSEILPFFREPCPYRTTPTGILYKDITLSKSSLLHRVIKSASGQQYTQSE